jgi:transcriptional regulator with XRE-family HTH domain
MKGADMQMVLATAGEIQNFDDETVGSISALVGENLRRLRTRQGLSLERLSKGSGVSRAMLGQIELGRSAPTINVLWKISRALAVPITVFVASNGEADVVIQRAHRSRITNSSDGRFSIRTVTPQDSFNRENLSGVRLAPKTMEEEEAHPVGSSELIVVTRGVLELRVNSAWHRLENGDSARFNADGPHAYRNSGLEDVVFFMMKVIPTLRA